MPETPRRNPDLVKRMFAGENIFPSLVSWLLPAMAPLATKVSLAAGLRACGR